MVNKALKSLSAEQLYEKMSNNAVDFVNQNFSEKKILSIFQAGLSSVYPEPATLCKDQAVTSDLDIIVDKKEKFYERTRS